MKEHSLMTGWLLLIMMGSGCVSSSPAFDPVAPITSSSTFTAPFVGSASTTPSEWRQRLAPAQYNVIWQQGTEIPNTSPLAHETRPGTYVSADCGVPLFRSEQKYDSGTGWPSFWAPISPEVVKLVVDKNPLFGDRTEVRDAQCGGHLGHVFDDGPAPTGKRYCMNGVALRFIPDATSSNSTVSE